MSVHRFRRLAGLKPLTEHIADDPHTNAEIERRMADWPDQMKAPTLDALEMIKAAGRDGITAEGLISQMRHLYPPGAAGISSDDMDAVVSALAEIFNNVIHQDDRGWLVWRQSPATTDEDEAPPAELSQMVDATYTGLEVMRELTRHKGSFTEDELAAKLVSRLHMASSLALHFANHLLNQFQSMLDSGGGSYAMREEQPTTREQNMDFLRSLGQHKPPIG